MNILFTKNSKIINLNKRKNRNNNEIYTKKIMNVKGHSAIDKMATQTNEAFAQSAIVPRSTQQFQSFFKGVEFTPAQKQKAVTPFPL